jgi:aryl-alcohol dehydrogenase-like predicted oxidoreductase
MVFGFVEADNDPASIATIHAALDAGITFLDTALIYTTTSEPSHSERVVAEALASHPAGKDVFVATKGGHYREGESGFLKNGRPEAIKAHCETSLRTLGVESLGLYQLHWPDPAVPIAESMGAFADLQREGKVRHVGVSNFDLEQLAVAQGEVAIASVQNNFSLLDSRDRAMVEHCDAHGIAYLPYSPFGGGGKAAKTAELVPATQVIADAHGVTPQQVALAWLLHQTPSLIPLVGCTRQASVLSSRAAADLALSSEELALLSP